MEHCVFKKCKNMQRLFKNHTWIGRGLMFTTLVIYTAAGAALFQNLESELPIPESLRNMYRQKSEANVTSLLEMLMDQTCEIPDRHERLEALYYLFTQGRTILVADKFANFGLSVYYCGSVYSTIGYGDMTPGTSGGRFATAVYALFGIPLFLAVLADTGAVLAYLCRRVCNVIKRVGPPMNTMKLKTLQSIRQMKRRTHEVTDVDLNSHSNLKDSCNGPHDESPLPVASVRSISIEEPACCNEKANVIREVEHPLETGSDSCNYKCSDSDISKSKVILHLAQSSYNLTEESPIATLQVESLREGQLQVTLTEPSQKQISDARKSGASEFNIVLANDQTDSRVSIVPSKSSEFVMSNTVACVLFLVYVLFGAFLFSYLEDWTYLNSMYFVVVTLLTIGFGDLTPSSNFHVFIFMVYSFVGLALASMYLNLLQENMHKARKVLLLRIKSAHNR